MTPSQAQRVALRQVCDKTAPKVRQERFRRRGELPWFGMGGMRRRDLPDGYFHVTARGVNGSAIFLEDVDRLDFLDLLARVTAHVDLRLVARCLMDTHT